MKDFKLLTSVVSNKEQLDQEYKNSLKDEYFSKMVSKLNLSRDYLEKYTSLLEESSGEFKNCSNCKGILECKKSYRLD